MNPHRTLALSAALLSIVLACGGQPTGSADPPVPSPAPGGAASKSAPSPAPAPTPVASGTRLGALTATSGSGVEAVIDGDESTSWKPSQDPYYEGVLLRFESAVDVGEISVLGCPSKTVVRLFLDGDDVGASELGSGMTALSNDRFEGRALSIFLRLEAKPGACIREVTLKDIDGNQVPLSPPRRVTGSIEVSSVLAPEVPYRAGYLFDQRNHFAWVEGAKGSGQGEWIAVRFDAPQQISAIDVWNGYQRSDDHFEKNARLKKIRLTVDGDARELSLADASGVQSLPVEPPLSGKGARIDVLEVFPGSKYEDLVVSELRFRDSGGPYTLSTGDLARAERALQGSLAGTPLAEVVGRVYRSRCSPSIGTLKLRGDSSFVWYGEREGEDQGKVEEILDGAWALRKSDGAWATTEIYARRQRVESAWTPYGQTEIGRDPVRVSGGSLSFALASEIGRAGLKGELAALGGDTGKERVSCIKSPEDLAKLVSDGAVLVKGTALTDLLVPVTAR